MADQVRISKKLSYWLRHRPEKAGITLDAAGWTSVGDVLAALARAGLPNEIGALLQVVEQLRQLFRVVVNFAGQGAPLHRGGHGRPHGRERRQAGAHDSTR